MKRIVSVFTLMFILFAFGVADNLRAQLVINEVYGGGGNTGATYNQDYIELFNSGAGAINLAGYNLWYASATGTFNQVVPLTGSIPGGAHYLVATTAVGANGINIPTPDVNATAPNMSATNGNVILTSPMFAGVIMFACPAPATVGVVDRIGYGTGNCPETAAAPAGSNTTSLSRAALGIDTGNNANDFTAGVPTPQAGGATAAAGIVAGRITNAKGTGLRFCTVLITGGSLAEPRYATTNSFGFYEFQDIALGETYVLQVFSKRYAFDSPSMILNLDGSVKDADFIGDER